MSSRVSTSWFNAEFPAPYQEEVTDKEQFSVTRTFAADLEPFGVFTVEETEVQGNAFIAVGAQAWVARFGDDVLRRLNRYQPAITSDVQSLVVGVASRDIEGTLDIDGPVLFRSRLRSRFSQAEDHGCVIVMWCIANLKDATAVDAFVESLQLSTKTA